MPDNKKYDKKPVGGLATETELTREEKRVIPDFMAREAKNNITIRQATLNVMKKINGRREKLGQTLLQDEQPISRWFETNEIASRETSVGRSSRR